MEYSLDGECLDSIEPTSDDLADGLGLGLGDNPMGCIALPTE